MRSTEITRNEVVVINKMEIERLTAEKDDWLVKCHDARAQLAKFREVPTQIEELIRQVALMFLAKKNPHPFDSEALKQLKKKVRLAVVGISHFKKLETFMKHLLQEHDIKI